MSLPPTPVSDLDRSIVTLGGRRLVFHCHHYNVFLQRSIEDGLGERAPALLTNAAMEAARGALVGLDPAGSPAAVIARAAAILADQGFGRADVTALGPWGGTAVMDRSHYAVGWLAKWGRRATPCCFFPAGWLAGAVAVAGGHTPERVAVREVSCLAAGAERCSFLVEVW
ncbi:MAG: hypothetical protein QM820_06730 [Minicystis sp.]